MDTTGNEQTGSYDDMKRALGFDVPVADPPAEPQEPKAEPTEPTEPTETPKEEPKDTEPQTQEPQSAEPATPEPAEEPTTVFDINEINQRFGTEFKDEESMKESLSSLKRISELEGQVQELESMKEKNLLLQEKLDPLQYFDNEDSFKAALFKKQFPDKDGSVAVKLFAEDLSQMSDKDVLAYYEMLDTPGLDKERVLATIERRLNIEDWSELDPVTETQLKIDANKARKSIDALKTQVKLPDKVDADSLAAQQREMLEQKKETLKRGWGDVAKEVVKTFPDLNFKDEKSGWDFKYSISQDFPEDVSQNMVSYMAENGIDLTSEAASTMQQAMKQKYVADNLDKIVKAVREDVVAKAEEKRLKEQHHPGTPKADSAPSKSDKSDVNQKILSFLDSSNSRKTFLDNN